MEIVGQERKQAKTDLETGKPRGSCQPPWLTMAAEMAWQSNRFLQRGWAGGGGGGGSGRVLI